MIRCPVFISGSIVTSPAPFTASPYRRPGALYKLAPGAAGMAVDTLAETSIDTARLSVAATVCTPAVDRQAEIIVPDGVDFTNYASNPVVLWEHGFCSEIPLPIARSEDESGKLTVTKSQGQIDAVAFFTDKDPTSYQIFGLIEAKIVRAVSIHVNPKAGTMREEIIENERIRVYPESELLEWSFGCIGVNPEAVAKILTANKIGNEVLLPSLAKTLRPWMPRAKGIGVGFDFTKGKTMPTTVAKTDPPAGAPADEEKPDDAVDDGADDATEGNDETPSAKVLGAVRSAVTGLVANIQAASNTYENPEAQKFLSEFVARMESEVAGIEACYSAVGGKSTAPADGEGDATPDEQAVKTWLAGASNRPYELLGYAARAERLAKCKGLATAERDSALSLAKSLRGVAEKAKADHQAAETAAQESLAKTLADMTAKAKANSDLLNSVLPKNKK